MQAKRRLATTSRACPLVVPNALYAQCFTTTAKIKPKKERGYWGTILNQRAFLDRIAPQLGIIQPSDWYAVPRKEIINRGGRGLFRHHPTLGLALREIYPQFPWELSKFVETTRAPPRFWQSDHNLRQALAKAEEKLGIQQPEDWYSVCLSDLREMGLPSGFNRKKLVELLTEKYPTHHWEKVYLLKGRFAQQKRLENAISTLFSTFFIARNVRKETALMNPETGDYLELDIWIPALNLAFEYQDKHHYASADYSYQPLQTYRTRDTAKRKLAEGKGITLLSIPCWWDGGNESLVATIKKARPELLVDHSVDAAPIPEDPPVGFFETGTPEIEGIGQPITACFLTRMNVDPANWWIFEKYDGVRAFWNPEKKAFYSRHGNKFTFPQHIIDAMPDDIFLDGELWFGRDNFREATRIANRVDPSTIDWSTFKYMVFDNPNNKTLYKERYAKLEQYFNSRPAIEFVELAPKQICSDEAHLEKAFQDIIDVGGEGVILRDPEEPYEPGRSKGYLKHKKYRDAEARIVGYAGQHQWECETPDGVRFTAAAGTSEFVKKWTPKIGDIVSFKHRGFLLGTKRPKLPSLHRLRPDLTWEDVVENWSDKKTAAAPTEALPVRKTKKHKPKGYWQQRENRVKFFKELAEEAGFDPSDAASWSNVTQAQVIARKGGASLLWNFNGSFQRALEGTFPELNLNVLVSSLMPKRYWRDIRECRDFFNSFAQQRALEPLDPETWYSIDDKEILNTQEGRMIQERHRGIRNALMNAYPDLLFAKWAHVQEKERWRDTRQYRTFFDDYAREQGFSPLSAANWYNTPLADLRRKSRGDGTRVPQTIEGYKSALMLAYPDLQFTWPRPGAVLA